MLKKLDEGQLAELQEFYDGNAGVVGYFAKHYGVSRKIIEYAVDHHGCRTNQENKIIKAMYLILQRYYIESHVN